MMRKVLDWAGYVGLVVLVAALVLPYLPFVRPEWLHLRSWLVGIGVALVVLSLLVHLRQARTALSGRTARYGLNTAIMILLLLGIITVVEAVSYRHNARLDLPENRRNSVAPQ